MPTKPKVWAVGERLQASLANAGLSTTGTFNVPTSVNTITLLIGQILMAEEALYGQKSDISELYFSTIECRLALLIRLSVSNYCHWIKLATQNDTAISKLVDTGTWVFFTHF